MSFACGWYIKLFSRCFAAVLQEQFIPAKYVEKKYICLPETYPGATAQTGLWEAVEGGNLRY